MSARSASYRLAIVATTTSAVLATLPGVAAADWTSADTTTAASVTATGVPNGGAVPSLSRTGQYVAYVHAGRILVRDRVAGRVTDVAPGDSPHLSDSGKVVEFHTNARLTAKGAGLYVYNVATGTLTFASSPAPGMQPSSTDGPAAISGNGQFVVFMMFTANLGADSDVVLVHDLKAGTTEVADVRPGTKGLPFRVSADAPSISADGRYVAFWADDEVSDLPAGVWVRDRTAKTSTFVSGAEVHGGTAVSDNGRYVAFVTDTKLIPKDTNGVDDIYVSDRTAKTTSRVSVYPGGAQSPGASVSPGLSGDGRYVVFSTQEALIKADTNGVSDVYVRDRTFKTTLRLSVGQGGVTGNGPSGGPAISGDGRHVAYTSDASNLVPGDTDTRADVFVRDMAGE